MHELSRLSAAPRFSTHHLGSMESGDFEIPGSAFSRERGGGGGDLDTSLAHPSMPTWSSLGSVFNYRVPHTWLRAYTTIQPPSICSPHPSSAQMLEQGPCQGPQREEESAHRHPAPNLSPSWYILQIHSKISKPGSL